MKSHRYRFCLLSVCSILLLVMSARAEQYALIVAISDYPELPGGSMDLPACKNDAYLIKNWIKGTYGFKDKNITELYDRQATTRNITTALRSIAAKARKGDSVLFYYTGHGTQVLDLAGDDEEDGYDETLVTYDSAVDLATGKQNPSNWLTDDLIRYHISRLRTNRTLVIFDSCHSGTGTRGFGDFYNPGAAEVIGEGETRAKFFNNGVPKDYTGRRPNTRFKTSRNENHAFIAGCDSAEQAYCVGGNSVLTKYLTTVAVIPENRGLDLERISSPISNAVATFIYDLAATDPNVTTSQTPQFQGNLKASFDDLLASTSSRGWTQEEPNVVTTEEEVEDMKAVTSWGDFDVKITSNQEIYKDGELMKVTVRSKSDGYLQLYHIAVDGAIQRIFPQPEDGDGEIKANKPITIPTSSAYSFEMGEPYGQEVIKAIVSSQPIAEEETDALEGVRAVGTRGLTVKREKPKIAHAVTYYQVRSK